MDITGTRIIEAATADVWEHLNSPQTLKLAIPGCEELSGTPQTGLEATITQKIGPFKVTFQGDVLMTNVVPARSYTLTGGGKGGVSGYARGRADIVLEPVPEGTAMHYTCTAEVGGKIGSIGGKLIRKVATRLVDTFFDRLHAAIEGRQEE